MNDPTPPVSGEPSIPHNQQLVQLQNEAESAATDPDVRERVRVLTERVLHERRVGLGDLRALVAAVTAGVGSGLEKRGGEMRQGLQQAVSGLDDAVASAAQAASYTLREAAAQGRAFKDNELKSSLEELRSLEGQIVDTLKQTARVSGGKLREELGYLSDHLRHSGTRTGAQVRDALQQLAAGVKASGQAGSAGVSEAATLATARLAAAASGVLAAVSESLKRHSERHS